MYKLETSLTNKMFLFDNLIPIVSHALVSSHASAPAFELQILFIKADFLMDAVVINISSLFVPLLNFST